MKTTVIKIGAAMLALCISIGNAFATEFRSADVQPDDYPTVRAVRYMADLVRQRSGGRHSIKAVGGGLLGQESETINQLRSGTLAMARVNIAPMNDICPETVVPTLPFLFRSIEHMRQALDGAVGEEILQACEAHGFVGLAFYDSGARSIYSVKKPIRALRDAKGLKIRVIQSDLWIAVSQAMGAEPTPMSFGQVYNALKNGTVDAAENNWSSYESTRHFEVARYYSLTEHSMAPEILLFSKKVWDTLAPEDQQLIRQAAKDSVPFMRHMWDERETRARKIAEAAGVRLVTVDKSSFAGAMKPVYEKFASQPKLKSLVIRVQKVR